MTRLRCQCIFKLYGLGVGAALPLVFEFISIFEFISMFALEFEFEFTFAFMSEFEFIFPFGALVDFGVGVGEAPLVLISEYVDAIIPAINNKLATAIVRFLLNINYLLEYVCILPGGSAR
jgi:hypothetical protein